MDATRLVLVIFLLVATSGSTMGILTLGKLAGHRRYAEADEHKGNVTIQKFHVTSRVTSRFAVTEVTSEVDNQADISKEVTFDMQIPESAFVTGLNVKIGNKTYSGKVFAKGDAAKVYKAARRNGKTAGHVRVRVRARESFRVAMNVEAGTRVKFVLTYQEMLYRRHGIYEHRISVRPRQIIDDLKVSVFITEPQGLRFVKVPPIQANAIDRWSGNDATNKLATIDLLSPEHVRVAFTPSREEQRAVSWTGITGDFVVQYDVTHNFNAGELQVLGSYFVHHFSPFSDGKRPAKKNVLFIIDVSGSMTGEKIIQTKMAFREILGDMRSDDKFNIIAFNDELAMWHNSSLMSVSDDNRLSAVAFVDGLVAQGSTDLNAALVKGLKMLNTFRDNIAGQVEHEAWMVIMLTDGNPTEGITNYEKIQENVAALAKGRFSIFCLGFGSDVIFEELEKLSFQNKGVARKIFVAADARLQLASFYDEVANPAMFNINISYPGNSVVQDSLTQTEFPVFFDGSEITVVGKLTDDGQKQLKTEVTALSPDNTVNLQGEISLEQESDGYGKLDKDSVDHVTERLWVYLTVNQLLNEMRRTDDRDSREKLKQRAVGLSITYGLVTRVTSMVVVDDEDYQVLDWVAKGRDDVDNTDRRLNRPPIQFAALRSMSMVKSTYYATMRPIVLNPNPPVLLRTAPVLAKIRLPEQALQERIVTVQQMVPPTTHVPPTQQSLQIAVQPREMYSFVIGGYNGMCEVGVAFNPMEPFICFRVPRKFINRTYTLFEVQSQGTEIKTTGSFQPFGSRTVRNSATACWNLKLLNNDKEHFMLLKTQGYLSGVGFRMCHYFHALFGDDKTRYVSALIGKLAAYAANIDLKTTDGEITQVQGRKLLLLSSDKGHYPESLFEP
ncbi:inter-alpha-trypsin inhibitor heavy chain H4-like [Ptychodera flava]|uniref:inter-alpha-trypsin inhibitor heavy chain H4-like n=1 Tax=Ptychodera flava TaxID=63121 RepID=UPI00396A0D03